MHVSNANMRIGLDGKFEGRTADEYGQVKAELAKDRPDGKVDDREVRFEMMRRRVESAAQARAQSIPEDEDPQKTMGLFTAPEGALGDSLTKQDAKWYRKQFKGLSAQHPDMTLMPGTMNWQERQRKQHGLGKKTALRTTGDVFHAGKRVHTVDKHEDVGDTMGQHARHKGKGDSPVSKERAQKWYGRGRGDSKSGSTFQVGGVGMGYEICGDHPAHRLRHELHETGAEPLDVHVVNSAGNMIHPGHVGLREQGLAVSSDAVQGETQIGRAEAGYDPNNQQPTHTSQSTKPVPGYLGMSVPLTTTRTTLPRTPFDPKDNPYAHEHKGRFRLPGR
ncbi:MAG: hypothetical protein IT385_04660 [Deltaproteobacteria bacterium]|nr:hypothetical protein [Deltaproteobacteria bacterium]